MNHPFLGKGTKNYAADLSLCLTGSLRKLKIIPLSLSRNSSSYSLSVCLFNHFLSISVMVFIAQHVLWGNLSFSFHIKRNWETEIILLKHLRRLGRIIEQRTWCPIFCWERTKCIIYSVIFQLFCSFWDVLRLSILTEQGSDGQQRWINRTSCCCSALHPEGCPHQHGPMKE